MAFADVQANGPKVLRNLRLRSELSQAQVATHLGRSRSWLSNVERGKIIPDRKQAKEIMVAIVTLSRA
jgi:transcriptional regulator with XRE-family HTH domain